MTIQATAVEDGMMGVGMLRITPLSLHVAVKHTMHTKEEINTQVLTIRDEGKNLPSIPSTRRDINKKGDLTIVALVSYFLSRCRY